MSKTLSSLTVLALLTACEEQAKTVPVMLTSTEAPGVILEPSPRIRETLDEAFGFWDVQYELVNPDSLHGVIDLALVDIDHAVWVAGGHHRRENCRRRIWVDVDTLGLTHELGHAWLGAEHSPDPHNLMHTSAGGFTVTEEQFEQAQDAVDEFLKCKT